MTGKEGESNKNVGVSDSVYPYSSKQPLLADVGCILFVYHMISYDFYRKKNFRGLLKLDHNNFEKLKNSVGLS